MSKNIKDYIEGIEPDENVPSIKGIIRKITPPDDKKETQILKIQDIDGSEFISLHIKDKALWVINPKCGNIISLTSTGGGKKASAGLTLKQNKNNGIKYITVTNGAAITMTEEDLVTETVDEEPLTAADSAIDNYVLDRLYIYKRCSHLVKEIKDVMFPPDKIAELATAVHINLERSGIAPRPTDKQLERKAVHRNDAKKFEKPSIEQLPIPPQCGGRAPEKKNNWRSFKHPKSGVMLGDEPIEKFATLYGPWVLRQTRSTLDQPMKDLYDNIVDACKELNIGVIDMYEAYLTQYAIGYEKNEKKRNEIIKKFEDGLVENEEVEKLPPTKEEAASIIVNFKSLWKALIEDDDE